MDALAAVCALLPGDAVYVRSAQTRKAAVAEVLDVTEIAETVSVRVRLVSGFCAWEGGEPHWADCTGAVLRVKPIDLEEIRE